ncbi:hypothetical protein IB257_25095 [Achromobacter sp. ACM03]|uniref:hypothetical protein n=1 Tax=Achromobacter sp. ACM03 TaxID=2769300 RepID=UPI00177FCAF0|nr:hypothetical protein [Achromobacter sp. ACM03]MBD9433228.1 hypothetical protein [Achromobacter sp. ACM03]
MVESNKLPVRYPEFAERVKAAMVNGKWEVQGIVDALKRAGVRITYEMVRRYTLGQAMPRQDKMAEIAQILGVSASYLQYGTDGGPAPKAESTGLAGPSTRGACYPFLRINPEDYAALDDDVKDDIESIIELRLSKSARRSSAGRRPGARTGTEGA